MKKAVVLGIVAILMVCIVPAVADESEAAVTERICSDLYVIEVDVSDLPDFYTSSWAFIEGSENHKAMLDYIADPLHADVPTEDDNDTVENHGAGGKTVYIYSYGPYIYYSYSATGEYSGYYGVSIKGTKVLEGNTISFFVKEGVDFRFDLIGVKAYNFNYANNSVNALYGAYSATMDAGESIEENFGTNCVITISCYSNNIATDVTYEASGYSLPNGSSTVFIVVAVVVSVAILIILILCGMHPRWEN